jgi:seryl-tRNA(Sec) selenium transferase
VHQKREQVRWPVWQPLPHRAQVQTASSWAVFQTGEHDLQIMGMAIPKIKPHETYVYLGIHVSLTSQWHANSKSLTARVLARLAGIRTKSVSYSLGSGRIRLSRRHAGTRERRQEN